MRCPQRDSDPERLAKVGQFGTSRPLPLQLHTISALPTPRQPHACGREIRARFLVRDETIIILGAKTNPKRR